MKNKTSIVLIREEKSPSDSRVVLTPKQCRTLLEQGYDIHVQRSDVRAYTDQEYADADVPLVDEVRAFDILIGVKEVPISNLIPKKTYFFFSHTIKEQAYNRRLLQTAIERHIRLIDYEVITNDNNQRLIAFGKFAGMVGAHNGLWVYGKRTGAFELPRMFESRDYEEVKSFYKKLQVPALKIVLTGTGRVAYGAAMVLDDMNIKRVNALDFFNSGFDAPVYTQLSSFYYASRKDGKVYDDVTDFYNHPQDYESIFHHFAKQSDIFINGIYWDNKAPAFFTIKNMTKDNFKIKVIADVTCDIAPTSSIPSTLRATTIKDPVFGFDPKSKSEIEAFQKHGVDMMTIDNLPNELPRDASEAFGNMFIEHVLPELSKDHSSLLDRATICQNGQLTDPFGYLQNYVDGK